MITDETWKIYIGELRHERRHWNKQLRATSAAAILNQGYARGKVQAYTFAINQALYWSKIK